MSDPVKPTQPPLQAVPRPTPQTMTPAKLRAMLFTKEEREKVKSLLRDISGFMYSDHNSRWIAGKLTSLAEIMLGEKIGPSKPKSSGGTAASQGGEATAPAVINMQGGSGESVLPRGARNSHVEIKDARGRVIKEVVDGAVFDVAPDGSLVPETEPTE